MKIVLLLVSFIIMSSCVGTIEKTEADASTIVPSKSKIVFGGITEAIAVAHNRLTVKFEAANGGSGQYDYSVYLNGNYSTPFTFIDGNLAITTSDGQLAIDVSGLDIGTSYSVGIRAKDRSTGVEDSNDVRVIASTLTYEVPLFSGVREVKNMPGIAAKNSLEVLWNKAIKSSDGPGGFSANPHEISGYRIYYRKDGQTSWLTKLISDPDITSNVLTSLDPQTSYEIKVVALDSDTPAISDENIRQISFSTLGDQPILFDGVSTATVAPNATGFNNIDLTWQAGTGGFDRYRIFYTDNPLTTSIDPQNQLDALNVDITDLTTTSYTLFVPNANTEYKVSVVACADALCSSYSSVSAAKVLIVKTSPPVAPFTGIDSIDVGLDRITLNWDFLPDATQGAYDSYEVLMTHNGNTTVLSNTGAVRLESIPATTAQSVNVVGVTEGEEYCFVVKSSITEPDYSKRVFENSAQFCGVPVYNAPGAVQVVEEVDPDNAPNLTKCIDIDTGKFTVKWTPPASGTYTKFQIFLDQGATLDYNGTEDAFVDFDPGLTEYSYTFNGLVAGQDYKVGIRTWFDHAGTIKTGLEISPIACTTDVDKLVPQGWENVISLGVKTDALNGGAVIPEVIVEKGDTLIDGTVVPFAAPIEFDEFLPTTPISLNSSLGSIGMVRLAWNDFKYTNGSYFSSNTNDANVGYKVYRLKYDHNTHANSHATLA
ncbi:MAG: fibronectin type III domain-containing protein, partial [Bacteriovoracaceae bacterium]|nr:fibronectin type III domain-containing protein [Bacteriovoracaceae bacterium]